VGVVNRVVASDALPAEAHGADARTADLTSHLFETEDTRNAVGSFLAEGPGKASYSGK
jgi:hypothetical protein